MILTKKEVLEQSVGLWAIPKSQDCMEPGEFPFRYELYGVGSSPTHWRDAAIFLGVHRIVAEVPEGIDLFAKCLETLDKRATEALVTYNERMLEIEAQRKSLMLIGHEKTTIVDGVELCDE